MFNASSTEVELKPGQAIGQILFQGIDRQKGWKAPKEHSNGWCAMVEPELKHYKPSAVENMLTQREFNSSSPG